MNNLGPTPPSGADRPRPEQELPRAVPLPSNSQPVVGPSKTPPAPAGPAKKTPPPRPVIEVPGQPSTALPGATAARPFPAQGAEQPATPQRSTAQSVGPATAARRTPLGPNSLPPQVEQLVPGIVLQPLQKAASHKATKTPPGKNKPLLLDLGPANAAGARRESSGARPQAVASARGRDASPSSDEHQTIDVKEAVVRRAPPWLISAAIHMALVILLGLMVVVVSQPPDLQLKFETYAEKIGDQLDFDTGAQSKFGEENETVLTPQGPPVADPLAMPAPVDILPTGNLSASQIKAPEIGIALMGRQAGMREMLGKRFGGTATTEAAVERALGWLARQQRRDGSWSLVGPYADGVQEQMENPQAATAMALLAFQGHGITHQTVGKYQRNVIEGWKWLEKQQKRDGNFFHEGLTNHPYYTQGQCTIAACELYAMTGDEKYKSIAERGIAFCLDGQNGDGGWRYGLGGPSDVSVTGWIVMALQSAKMAKINVPVDALQRVTRFLNGVAVEEGSRYPYQSGGPPTLAMTAEAMLCRQYLGWGRNDPRLVAGLNWIIDENNLVNFRRDRDVYYWYYATQVCHHMEGAWWEKWNRVMRQAVPEHQVTSGKEAGSWDPNRPSPDQWAPYGGRLYVTCLSVYMLEVYYRHLPIYSNVYNELLISGRNPGFEAVPEAPAAETQPGEATKAGDSTTAAETPEQHAPAKVSDAAGDDERSRSQEMTNAERKASEPGDMPADKPQ